MKIIGVNHFKNNYDELMSKLEEIKPDALFVEYASPKDFEDVYYQLVGNNFYKLLTGKPLINSGYEVRPVFDYASKHGVPVYCVDRLNPLGQLSVSLIRHLPFKLSYPLVNLINNLRDFIIAKNIKSVKHNNGVLIIGGLHKSVVSYF